MIVPLAATLLSSCSAITLQTKECVWFEPHKIKCNIETKEALQREGLSCADVISTETKVWLRTMNDSFQSFCSH
jgi:hypothetical protein